MASTTTARTRAEAEAEPAAGIEAEFEAGRKARSAGSGGVGTKVVAELAAGLAALLMQGVALGRTETESARWWCEWVGHVFQVLLDGKHLVRFRYSYEYRKLS